MTISPRKRLLYDFMGRSWDPAEKNRISDRKRAVLAIALPALAELVFMQLASIVDNAMVGRLGNWALSAVGYTLQPLMLLLTVIQAMHTGATALIARYFGENNPALIRRAAGQTISLSVLAALFFTAAGSALARQLVILMGASSPEAVEAGTEYFRIRLYGLPVQSVMLACSACYRGVGKTRITMIYNSVGNLLNVAANYALIYGAWGFPRMGVAGAAWATNLGMGTSMLIAVLVMTRGVRGLKLEFRQLFRFDGFILRNIFHVGTPAMAEQMFLRLGMLLYMRMVAFGGEDMYAAHIITQNIMVLTFSNGQAFGTAATALMGQGIGAGERIRGERDVCLCTRYCLYVSCMLAMVFVFLGRSIAGLYTTDAETVALVGRMLILVAVIQPMMGSQLTMAGALRGAGDARAVTRFSAVGIVIIRPIVCGLLMFVLHLGLFGAWAAYFTDQLYRSWRTLKYYSGRDWISKIRKLEGEGENETA